MSATRLRHLLGIEDLSAAMAERVLLIAINTALVLGLGSVDLAGVDLTLLDLAGLAAAAGMLVALLGRAVGNLRALAKEEPAAARR